MQQRLALDAKLRSAPSQSGDLPIDERRARFAGFMASFSIPSNIRTAAIELAGLPAIEVEPDGASRPGTILYFHGGSFMVGSPETAMTLTANLVVRSHVKAISLDYRLAPEHPFPAAIDDCLAAFRALLDRGVPADTIAFVGDSAGGGLAVTTCLAARAAGLPMPAAVVAFSPVLDHSRTGSTLVSKEGVDPYFTAEGLRRAGDVYLAGNDPRQPLLSPALYADLAGMPAILLQVGTNELLLDDSVRFAARATEADVDVVLDVTAGVPHVFQAFVEDIDEAGKALDRAAAFIVQHLGRTT